MKPNDLIIGKYKVEDGMHELRFTHNNIEKVVRIKAHVNSLITKQILVDKVREWSKDNEVYNSTTCAFEEDCKRGIDMLLPPNKK